MCLSLIHIYDKIYLSSTLGLPIVGLISVNGKLHINIVFSHTAFKVIQFLDHLSLIHILCKFSSYPGGSVTFDNSYTGEISGRIVYDSPSASDWSLAINGNGSFGGIDLSETASKTPNITVSGGTFASDVSEYVEDGYASIGADGSFTIKPATEPTDDSAAEVGGVYYKSVQNAINAADDGATVTLYKSVSEDIVIDEKSVVLDLNGFTLTNVENEIGRAHV